MGQNYGPKLVTDGLALSLDLADANPTYATFNDSDLVREVRFANANTGNEERIEKGTDPWGRQSFLDRSINNDTGSNYDGGDTSNIYDVDNTSKYRFTYFFRVDKKGSNGTLYFGLYGYNASTQNIGVFSNTGTGTAGTNPYFSYPGHHHSGFEEGQWYMFVGYVHPEGSTNVSDSTAGYYHMGSGEKIGNPSSGNITHNGVWQNATAKTRFRYYLYYSTDPTVEMSWYQARIDKVDGNEASITDMLNYPPNTVRDLTGNARNFKTYNTSTSVSGVSFDSTYKSINLNGSTNFLELGTDHDYKTSGGWTVSTWFKHDVAETGLGNFIGSESIHYNSWYWSVHGQKLALWDLSPGSVWKYGNTTIAAGTWYHATLVSDANNTHYYCYLNGEDDMSSGWSAYNGSWQSNKAGLRIRYIGRGNSANGRYIDGNVASTNVWTRALTAAEVKSNFNAHRKRFGV